MLETWSERSKETRALFNPVFCGTLICIAVRAYEEEKTHELGLPLSVSFLILPLILHTETRMSLPKSTRTTLSHWLSLHPELYCGMSARVDSFIEITCEAVRFAIAGGILKITAKGQLRHISHKPRGLKKSMSASAETMDCCNAAKMFGRWAARVPNPTFLFRILRLKVQ